MSRSFVSDFQCLGSAARIDLLTHLLGECTLQEQLAVLKILPGYLCRVFLVLLPPELVVNILVHLDYRDVLKNCSLVRVDDVLCMLK